MDNNTITLLSFLGIFVTSTFNMWISIKNSNNKTEQVGGNLKEAFTKSHADRKEEHINLSREHDTIKNQLTGIGSINEKITYLYNVENHKKALVNDDVNISLTFLQNNFIKQGEQITELTKQNTILINENEELKEEIKQLQHYIKSNHHGMDMNL